MDNMNEVTAVVKNEKGSAIPYLIGWFMGVPVTLLVLVFLLRSIF